MNKRTGISLHPAALILLLIALGLNAAVSVSRDLAGGNLPGSHRTFVEITGEIRNPGVYAFSQGPRLEEIFRKAGFEGRVPDEADFPRFFFSSGSRLVVKNMGNQARVEIAQMPAFYKMTLGIPISLNQESEEGLTALPGIGPGLARSIVRKRETGKRFRTVEDLLSVSGIRQRLYRRIRPYLKP